MSNLHPKLNWEAFQKVRARRKRRRLLWWFASLATSACIAGLVVVQFTSTPTNPPAEKPAMANTEVSADPVTAPLRTEVTETGQSPEKVAAAQQQKQAEQLLGAEKSPVAASRSNPATPEQPVLAISKRSSAAQAASTVGAREEAEQAAALSSNATTTSPASATASDAFTQKAAPATPAVSENAAAEPIEKMKLLKLQSLMRQLLDLPATLALVPATALPTPDKEDGDEKKVKVPAKNPIWLSLAWSPWHSAEFLAPELDAMTELNYRALNSTQAVLRIQLKTLPKGSVSIEPQFIEQRFQTQFNGQFAEKMYAPGSVVGYLQTVKGIEAVIADSVPGISRLGLRQNGVQREFSLPVTVDYALYRKGYFQVSTAASLGLHYLARYQGLWYDGVQLVALKETPAMFGLLAAGKLSLNFQPGKIRYYCSWVTTYRSTVRVDQPALRNQVWIGMSVPLKR